LRRYIATFQQEAAAATSAAAAEIAALREESAGKQAAATAAAEKEEAAATALAVGSGRYQSSTPRHGIPYNPRNEGSKCLADIARYVMGWHITQERRVPNACR